MLSLRRRIYNERTVSDLRSLTAYPWLRRRCRDVLAAQRTKRGADGITTEGVEGNVRASRAWKGNGSAALVHRRAAPPTFPEKSVASG